MYHGREVCMYHGREVCMYHGREVCMYHGREVCKCDETHASLGRDVFLRDA